MSFALKSLSWEKTWAPASAGITKSLAIFRCFSHQRTLLYHPALAQVHIHVIFLITNGVPFLADAEFRKAMHAYPAPIMKAYEPPAQIVGGTADRVHIVCDLSRSATVAKVIGRAALGFQ